MRHRMANYKKVSNILIIRGNKHKMIMDATLDSHYISFKSDNKRLVQHELLYIDESDFS